MTSGEYCCVGSRVLRMFDVRQTADRRDADEQALLGLLPADGSPADSTEIRSRLGWDAERYASACVRLEAQGFVLSGQGRGESACRDLGAVAVLSVSTRHNKGRWGRTPKTSK